MPRINSKSRLKRELLSLYLDPETADAVRTLSEKTLRTQQSHLREAVEDMLKKYAKELRK